MSAKSRNARSESLTTYCTDAPKFFKSFSCRTCATFLEILDSLPNTVGLVGLCRQIQQSLVGFRILHYRFGFSVNGEDYGLLRLFQLFRKFSRVSPERRH